MSFARESTKLAKQKAREQANSLELWYRRRYNLAPNDPRFLALTPHDLEVEYWTQYYADNPAQEEVSDDDFNQEAILAAIENGDWEEVAFE